MSVIDLSGDSKLAIKEYVAKGFLSKDKINVLWSSTTDRVDFLAALRLFVELSPEKIDVIWHYIRNDVWKGVLTRDDRLTIFNEYEAYFFDFLLKRGGLVSYSVSLSDVFPTPYVAKKTIDSLLGMGLIEKIVLTTNEVFYLLSLDFYHEVFRKA